jgi:hypothetical protein
MSVDEKIGYFYRMTRVACVKNWLLICFASLFLNLTLLAQEFEVYNPHRVGPYVSYWHEWHARGIFSKDYDPVFTDEPLPGNISPGYNYGLGAGYQFLFGLDGAPQILGVSFSTDFFPNRCTRINAGFVFRLLAVGNEKINGGFLTGFSLNWIYDSSFKQVEMGSTLDMLSLQYKRFELVWGLQSNVDRWVDSKDIDDGFHLFKLSYKHPVR